jgi:hypothetical protein
MMPPENHIPGCALAFPYQQEAPRGAWLGGDSNFSVVLSPNTALMTFQDTFVGGASIAARSGSAIVSNTIAKIGCGAEGSSLDYFWRFEDEQHRAIFNDTHPSGDRLWIQQPWLHTEKLFLTATRVGEGGELGFEEHGMTLARVNNPHEPPDAWQIDYFNLTEQRVTVGKGAVVFGEYVYLFTPHAGGTLLARLGLDRLLEATISEADLEYLSSDDSFQPGLELDDATLFGMPANTGLTIRFHEASSRWLALYVSTSGWPSQDIVVSSAERLEGPWSAPEVVYQMPEMVPGSDVYDVDNICYGGAEHVAFNPEPDERLLFTYTCNSLVFAKQVANLDLYVPVVVDVPNPLAD